MRKVNPFITVMKREIHFMTSRKVYLFAVLLFPLFTLFVMSTIFNNGSIEQLPVGIVDEDNSSLSRSIIRNLETVPQLRVTHIYANVAEAQNDVVSKEIYGYAHILPNFEKDVLGNKGPVLPFYYHYAFLSVGSEVLQGFSSFLIPFSALPLIETAERLGISSQDISAMVAPVSMELHPLKNPSLNYSIYLSYPYFYVIFQILILLVTVFALGSEYKKGQVVQWLQQAGGNAVVALYGKLFPYFMVFTFIGFFANIVLFQWIGIPLATNLTSLLLALILFILATQAIAVFIFSIYPNLPIIISFVSMFGSLGATMVGVTFPVSAMPPVITFASSFFPVRHFIAISQNLRYEGWGFEYVWTHYAALLVFILLPLLMFWRLFPKRLTQTVSIGR